MIKLPPCVSNAITNAEKSPQYTTIIASYVKTYINSPRELGEVLPPELMPKVFSAMTKNVPTFSCDLVTSIDSSLCDDSRCPLFAEQDPVAFLLNNVESAEWDVETSDVSIKFTGIPQVLVLNAYETFKNPRDATAIIATFTLQNMGKAIYLSKKVAKLPDGTRQVTDQLRQFLEEVYVIADKVYGDDTLGVGELILDIVNTYQIVPPELASVESEVFVYVDSKGKQYIAIEPNIFRAKARSKLGIPSNRKLLTVLARYGIAKRRVRLHDDRKYVFLIPEEKVEEYAGVPLQKLLSAPSVQDNDIMGLLGDGQ